MRVAGSATGRAGNEFAGHGEAGTPATAWDHGYWNGNNFGRDGYGNG